MRQNETEDVCVAKNETKSSYEMKWNEMNDERSCQYLSKFLAVINAFIINLLYTATWSKYGRWNMV